MSGARIDDIQAIVSGDHRDPFGFLGPHADGGALQVRSFQPGARAVRVLDAANDAVVADLPQVHAAGLFAGAVDRLAPFDYRLAVDWAEGSALLDDPYRLPPVLDSADLQRFAHGELDDADRFMGAHPRTVGGRDGVLFAVWAPNARRVSVIGDFNYWDGRRHPMRLRHDGGVWELFIPGLSAGARYKYEIKTAAGVVLPPKADPFAFQAEMRPQSASIVCALPAPTVPREPVASDRARPMTIYEVHLGSWRRAADGGFLSYDQLVEQLVPYVGELGFTHVEFLPVTEYPFDGSWGYQPTGLFAPSSRFGAPAGFRRLVDALHAAGIGVILDWVPGHFPNDPHGLANFDGTHLFDHADPRLGLHKDWDTLIYNYGRREVANFLISSALFWLGRYGIDGLRVDAVASMLYLDYSREPGEWLPNRFGGRENIEAIEFLRRLNTRVYALHPHATTTAEESTAWPMVSRPVYAGGLGFGYKWNMGWMHDTLSYMTLDPIYRASHHDTLTFSLIYAFDENFVLPLSHDEVVHGKRSLFDKMPGDDWQKRANLRAYFGFMYGHPGKKLLFMGGEFAQQREWHHDRGLDWHLLDDAGHRGIQRLVGDLNRLHRHRSALHARDCEPAGFEWIDSNDRQNSVVSFLRRGLEDDWLIVVCNFTPVVRHGYRIGVPLAGRYREILNTDAQPYGGSGIGSIEAGDGRATSPAPLHGRPFTLELTLPPLAAVYLERVPDR